MAKRIVVHAGDKYAQLTVIREVPFAVSPTNGRPTRKILCKCDCGTEKVINFESLRCGSVRSCGCLCIGHGLSKTALHKAWIGMRQRCLNPRNAQYPYYGGRGISVCERWNSFELFLEDMGERPAGLTLDRIDNDGNYEPGNCRWATRLTQQRNTRHLHLLTHDGKTLCLAEWSELTGISVSGIKHRLKSGWSIKSTLEEPLTQGVRPVDV